MKKTIIAAAALVAMVGCNKTLIEAPISEADYGYINLGVTADTEMVVTKTLTAVEDPSEYNIKIIDNVSKETKFDAEYKDMPETGHKVAEGTYTVVAENISSEEALTLNNNYGAKRVLGTNSTVEVEVGKTTTAEVNCYVVNSGVIVAYNQSFTNLFTEFNTNVTDDTNNSVTIDNSSRTLSMTTGLTAFFNIPEEGNSVSLKWVLTAKNKDGIEKTYYNIFSVEQAKIAKLVFTGNAETGSITVKIYADLSMTEVSQEFILDPITGEVTTPSNE